MASLDQRTEVLENLCSKYPDVGWSFCMSQLDSMPCMTSGTYEPRWRDDTCEDDRTPTDADVFDFGRKCFDLVLAWPEYDLEKLKGLILLLGVVQKDDRDRIHGHIDRWLATIPAQADIADLREHVRTRTMTRRARRQKEMQEGVADGRKLFARLEPTDLLQRHRWLFDKQWVEYSGNKSNVKDFSLDAHERWITEERAKSLREILDALGCDGIFELCALADAAKTIGWTLAPRILSRDEILSFLLIAVRSEEKYDQVKLDQCVSGT